MEFPAYVPAAVREKLAHYLEGEKEGDIPGYIYLLASANAKLDEIERAIEVRQLRGETGYLDSLNEKKIEAGKHRDYLANNVNCLLRLAHDSRMRDAFALLTREFSDDEQWGGFIFSAWVARVDYAPYRERLKRAAELKGEIAEAAANLAKLLREFSNIGIIGPDEFYSIPELLRKTDNHDVQNHNLEMWRAMRNHVLGDPPWRDASESEPTQGDGDQSTAPIIVIRTILEPDEKPAIDPAEIVRGELRYVWGLVPDFSELLDTVTKAARDFKPRESGMIGAAIISRQRSITTEYLRAFANRLTDSRLTLTTAVMQAMAIVTNVAINLPDIDVTYDDVRKALARLGGEPLENSKLK